MQMLTFPPIHFQCIIFLPIYRKSSSRTKINSETRLSIWNTIIIERSFKRLRTFRAEEFVQDTPDHYISATMVSKSIGIPNWC